MFMVEAPPFVIPFALYTAGWAGIVALFLSESTGVPSRNHTASGKVGSVARSTALFERMIAKPRT
jgi:hypothetical protein